MAALICTVCAQSFEAAPCPAHPDEPLLELTRAEVVEELQRLDRFAWDQQSKKLELAGFAAGFLIGLVPALVTLGVVVLIDSADGRASSGLLVPGALVAGTILLAPARLGMKLGNRRAQARFKPKFSQWIGSRFHGEHWIDP